MSFFHQDKQNSVIAISNDSGAVTNQCAYSTFGESAALSGTVFGYTGQRYDAETGLYYYKARYYSPILGRFLQPDPIGYMTGTLNLYAYVNNNPLQFTDPLGLVEDEDDDDDYYDDDDDDDEDDDQDDDNDDDDTNNNVKKKKQKKEKKKKQKKKKKKKKEKSIGGLTPAQWKLQSWLNNWLQGLYDKGKITLEQDRSIWMFYHGGIVNGEVTNLNPSGPGSFAQYALNSANPEPSIGPDPPESEPR